MFEVGARSVERDGRLISEVAAAKRYHSATIFLTP